MCVGPDQDPPFPRPSSLFCFSPAPPPPKVPAGPALISLQPQVRMRRSPTLERPNVFQ